MLNHETLSPNREDNYTSLLETLPAFIDKEDTMMTVLANVSALMNVYIDSINWVGFYLLKHKTLHLGPFQGLPACTRIALGQGVCGTSAARMETLIVDDVHAFAGHIVCDGNSKSEIVVPLIKNGVCYGVIDIDSPIENRFSLLEKTTLEKVATVLVDILF